jgi:hypothetical protein
MTPVRTHHCAAAIIAGALTTALAISIATPVSARTFDFNSVGSMVQQPLPTRWACAMQHALTNRRIPCRKAPRPRHHTIQTNSVSRRVRAATHITRWADQHHRGVQIAALDGFSSGEAKTPNSGQTYTPKRESTAFPGPR